MTHPINNVGNTISAHEALLDHLPKDLILDRYRAAGGHELATKFASPASSAVLVANAFGLFEDRPELLTLPSPTLEAGSATSVRLEVNMRFPWRGGLHPWLDVAIETQEALIGVESKRFEPFRDRKAASFSSAYGRPVWGNAMGPFEAMRDALQNGLAFHHLDAAQLVSQTCLRPENAGPAAR